MNWYKKAQNYSWIYHNTKKEYLESIKQNGLEAGSFSTKPIDFGGDIWIAIQNNILPERTQSHQYGSVTAIEPAWDNFVISPENIYIASKSGKILGALNELV